MQSKYILTFVTITIQSEVEGGSYWLFDVLGALSASEAAVLGI